MWANKLSKVVLASLFCACSSGNHIENDTTALDSIPLIIDTTNVEYLINNNEDESVYKIIQSIPHSLEAISFIPTATHDYLKISIPDVNLKSIDEIHRAMNLGMLTASLGYAAAHREFDDFLKILEKIDTFKSSLGLAKHIEDATLRQLLYEKNISSKSLDSLLQLSTLNYDRTNYELTKLHKEHVSVAIIVGAWLEYSYLQCSAYKQKKNTDLRIKILEQKLVLKQLIKVINQCKEKQAHLFEDLKKVEKTYTSVQINECDGMPKMSIKDGEIVIDAPCQLITNDISDAQFDAIAQSIINLHKKWKL